MKSQEGTTQGDPLAMSMYALGILPLIHNLESTGILQVWYADDATGGGSIPTVKLWWEHLRAAGPAYGYYPNAVKSWLMVKESAKLEAISEFEGTGLNIMTDGRRLLGAAIGTSQFKEEYVENTISPFVQQLTQLAEFAKTQPHVAYTAFTQGLLSKWTFLSRVMSLDAEPLEDCIRQQLIPNLLGRDAPGDKEGDLLALQPRLGGMGLLNPIKTAVTEFQNSLAVSTPLVRKILAQDDDIQSTLVEQKWLKRIAHQTKWAAQNSEALQLKEGLPASLQRSMELASQKGASNWLSARPLEKYDFVLHKSAFSDAVCLRYGWQPQNLPEYCTCGHSFTIDHALSCPIGGYPIIRYNELRDLTAGFSLSFLLVVLHHHLHGWHHQISSRI